MHDDTASGPILRYQRSGQVALLTAANPQRMNAMTAAMWRMLPDHVARAETDPAVRVIVVRGEGARAFSAGADISEFATARTGEAAAAYDDLNNAAFAALLGCSKPTIAMIHGHCLGGGLAIALCCDLRLADEAAQFAIPAAKLGIGYNPRWMTSLLAAVRPAQAKEIMFTGRRFDAAEALAMGLVNRVVAPPALAVEVEKLAAAIGENAPLTIKAAKRTIDELSRRPATDLAALDALVKECFESHDYAEGRRAFLEKRRPKFEGR